MRESSSLVLNRIHFLIFFSLSLSRLFFKMFTKQNRHFTIRGPDSTEFEGGYYHGRILLPAEYPFKPPNIVFLTPSGRFETNTKVCLSFSAYHPELWQPAWGIRLILEALISFLPSKGDGAIGALDWTREERQKLAKKSVEYCCPVCGRCSDMMKRIEEKVKRNKEERKSSGKEGRMKPNRFQKEIEQLHALQMASHGLDVPMEEEMGTAKVLETSDGQEQEEKGTDGNSKEKEEEKEDVKQEDEVEKKQNESSPVAENISRNNGDEIASKTTLITHQDETNKRTILEKKEETILSAESDGNHDGNISEERPEVEHNHVQMERLDTPILSDPVIHTGIAVFSIIVWLLVRKLSAIIEDMKALEHEIQQLR